MSSPSTTTTPIPQVVEDPVKAAKRAAVEAKLAKNTKPSAASAEESKRKEEELCKLVEQGMSFIENREKNPERKVTAADLKLTPAELIMSLKPNHVPGTLEQGIAKFLKIDADYAEAIETYSVRLKYACEQGALDALDKVHDAYKILNEAGEIYAAGRERLMTAFNMLGMNHEHRLNESTMLLRNAIDVQGIPYTHTTNSPIGDADIRRLLLTELLSDEMYGEEIRAGTDAKIMYFLANDKTKHELFTNTLSVRGFYSKKGKKLPEAFVKKYGCTWHGVHGSVNQMTPPTENKIEKATTGTTA